ncbi:fatty acyl-AMP ligase [Streptomyces sp. NPDC005811]|uniref:fatty acyl-AMP ligase n=1 Tax=Streptomyces sp. NPDC005811 TaxID=3154565 RepID=UPI0033E4D543
MEQETAPRQRERRARPPIPPYTFPPAATLSDVLDARARSTPHRPAFRFLPDGTSDRVGTWTYAELKRHADAVAARLRAGGHGGGRVVLAGRPGLPFVAGLLGVFQAGATAVPAFPPTNRRAVTRLRAILADCGPGAILADSRHERRFAGTTVGGQGLPPLIPLDDLPPAPAATASPDPVRPADTALIQYSSGSTGDPKGVELTHAHLMSNCRSLERHIGVEDDRVGLTWLPPYHDMGLIGTIMLALHGGWPLLMMTPEHFVQQPARWLRAITEHRVTITVAPNFAFQLCADTVDDEDLAGVDLSSLRQVFCGSEPIALDTLDAFRKRYVSLGYREKTLIPCYGLAEATLLVTAKEPGTDLRVEWVDREALSRGRAVTRDAPPREAAPHPEGDAVPVVGCGAPAEGHELLVVDPDSGRTRADGVVGEIWVHGPHVAVGYHGRPGPTAAVFGATPADRAERHGGPSRTYLRTGDLGYLRDGELFVTGRISGLLVVAGRNLYPQDVERTVDRADPSVHRSVVFAVPGTPEEQVVVVAEVRDRRPTRAELDALRGRLLAAVAAEHGVRPAGVHLVRIGTIPLTTSGKIRRAAARSAYPEHTLGSVLVASDAVPSDASGDGEPHHDH